MIRQWESGCRATVLLQRSRKSNSVRVGLIEGAMDSPETTWKVAVRFAHSRILGRFVDVSGIGMLNCRFNFRRGASFFP